jgi:2-polyprenyl-3-methyl-5-hydroxy-6-metoxy-1,4-benzoquinol methylase
LPETIPCGLCGSPDAAVERRKSQLTALPEPYQVKRCLRCGFEYLSPRPTGDELVALYAVDPYWQGPRMALRPLRRRFDAARFARLERWSGGPKSLLSVACLDGGYAMQNARRRGWETLGVEFVDVAVEHARNLGMPIVRSRLWDLDAVDGTFDAIHSLSLEHVPDVPKTLRQFREHLVPGGVVVIEAPNQFNALKETAKLAVLGVVGNRLLDHVYQEANQYFHLSFFTPRTLRTAFQDAGFEVLEHRTYMAWDPVYHFTPRFRVTKELVYLIGGLVDRGPSIELIARAP